MTRIGPPRKNTSLGSHISITLAHAIGVVVREVVEGGLSMTQVIGVILGQLVEEGVILVYAIYVVVVEVVEKGWVIKCTSYSSKADNVKQ